MWSIYYFFKSFPLYRFKVNNLLQCVQKKLFISFYAQIKCMFFANENVLLIITKAKCATHHPKLKVTRTCLNIATQITANLPRHTYSCTFPSLFGKQSNTCFCKPIKCVFSEGSLGSIYTVCIFIKRLSTSIYLRSY